MSKRCFTAVQHNREDVHSLMAVNERMWATLITAGLFFSRTISLILTFSPAFVHST